MQTGSRNANHGSRQAAHSITSHSASPRAGEESAVTIAKLPDPVVKACSLNIIGSAQPCLVLSLWQAGAFRGAEGNPIRA